MAEGLPPNAEPADAADLMAPRLVEFCFQTAGVWEIMGKSVLALPSSLASVSLFRRPEFANGTRLFAIVEERDGGGFNAKAVDESGCVYLSLEGYRTIPLMGG